MHIESAMITGVADGAPQNFSFTPGVNVLLGGNGSGKTAAVWAVRQIFFPHVGSRYPVGTDAGVVVTLEHNGRSRTWARNLHSGELKVTEGAEVLYSQVPQEGDPELAKLVDEFFGAGRLEQWLNTSIVSDSHAQNEGGKGAQILVEDEAVATLQGKMLALVSENEAQPGELDVLGNEIEAKARQLQGWEENASQIEQNIDRQTTLRKSMGEAESAAQSRREVMETLERFQDLSQEAEGLVEEISEIQRERDVVKRVVEAVEKAEKELEGEYGHFLNAGTELEDALQEWTEATSRHHDIQRRLHLARQAVSIAPKTNTQRNGIVVGVGLGALSFFAFMGAGALVLGAIIGPIVALLGYGVVWGKDRSLQSMLESRRREIIELETENQEVETILEESKESLGKLGNLGHPMAIRRSVIQYWRAREEVEELRQERDKHASLGDLIEQHEQMLARRSELEQEMKDLLESAKFLSGIASNKATLAGEVDMARAQCEASNSRVIRLRDEMAGLQDENSKLVGGVKSLGRLEREYDELEHRMYGLKGEYDAVRLAHDVLTEAVSAYRDSHQKRLADRAGELLAKFTNRNYTQVRFSEGSQPEALHADGAWRSPEAMSHGRSEQLYMAVRLAEASEAREPWPLILDEPFLLWDPECRRRVLEELERLVEFGGQVILLSQDPGFSEWGSVIHLDDGAARSQAA